MAHFERERTMNKNEIQKTESPLMAAAELVKTSGNMDVAKLKELLDLQERWDATQAKKAYVQAMSDFKTNPPEIEKDKAVQYHTQKGDVDYKHATLHNVTTKINTELSKHGLTASWVTSQENGSIKVTCKITHVMGHSEQTCLSAPPDATGSKNPIQAIGSTVTYLQRYTLLALTGLATYNQDVDGAGANNKNGKETPKGKQNAIVEQAFFEFETENQEYLNENPGFAFDIEKFTAAIIKHFKKLPTRTESIQKIVTTVKPEEVSVWQEPPEAE